MAFRILMIWRARWLQWRAARVRLAATDLLQETERMAEAYRRDVWKMQVKARCLDHAAGLMLIEVNQERDRRK